MVEIKNKIIVTLQIEIPEGLEIDEQEVLMLIASRLYEKGKLSLGEAAELAGYSKITFMELLGDFGVSIFNYSPEELEQDAANAKGYLK